MSLASFAIDRLGARIRRWDYEHAVHRGRQIGRLGYRLDGRHRRVALANLAQAFPDSTPAWRDDTARRSFEQAGRTAVELLWSPNLFRDHRYRELVRIEGVERLREQLARDTGAILAAAHFGNWELLGLLAPVEGVPLVSLARPLDDADLDARLTALRTATGQRILSKHRALRPTLRALRRGQAVGILGDQNTVRREAVFVPYFGKLAATNPAVAHLHRRTGAPIFPVFAIPEEHGYRVLIEPPLEVPDARAGDGVEAITAAVVARLEHHVRACPHAWLWMHDRWRERPVDE